MLSSLCYPLRGLTIAYGSLDYVYKGTTFGKYAVRLCPLVSAYVRVLTFRRIILTVRLLHLASCSNYTWFILLNISYLCRGSLTPNPSPKGRGVITLKAQTSPQRLITPLSLGEGLGVRLPFAP